MENPFELLNQRLQRIEAQLTEIYEAINSKMEQPVSIPSEKLIGDKALADYLGCTIQTVSRLKKAGRFTFHRYGRKYYYLSHEIDECFKAYEKGSENRKRGK